jgi:LAS superfamily LD-carboxypeptidase LdcB
MKLLWVLFLACLVVLGVTSLWQGGARVVVDGRLACPPLPSRLVRAAEAPLPPPSPAQLARLESPPSPAPVAAAKLVLVEPPPADDGLAAIRLADRLDWGIPDVPAPRPVVVASVPEPRNAAPVVAPPVPPPPPEPVLPNLYLPAGATTEEEAILTLIKAELTVHEEPHAESPTAPFTLREGERVRPMTRLRNETDFDWIKFERNGRSWWAKAEYFVRIDLRNKPPDGMKNLPIGQEPVDRETALPPDYKPTDLVAIDRQFVLDGREILARREVVDAAHRMVRAAAKEGKQLRIFSGYRDFDYQKKLYLEAIEKNGPKQTGVAEPGYSEHQLGTTIDLSNTDIRHVLRASFGMTPEGRWLRENAEKFGFRFSYTSENVEQSGYKPEPWHLRYMGPALTDPSDTKVAQGE